MVNQVRAYFWKLTARGGGNGSHLRARQPLLPQSHVCHEAVDEVIDSDIVLSTVTKLRLLW